MNQGFARSESSRTQPSSRPVRAPADPRDYSAKLPQDPAASEPVGSREPLGSPFFLWPCRLLFESEKKQVAFTGWGNNLAAGQFRKILAKAKNGLSRHVLST